VDSDVNDLSHSRRHRFVSTLLYTVALLLLVAAGFKIYAMFQSHWEMAARARSLNFALIAFELLVAFLLFLNFRPTLGWGLAVAAFTIFAGVSARNAFAGGKGCGCFGPAAIDPRIMTVVDLVIVVALLITGPRPPRSRPRSLAHRALALTVVTMMLLAVGATIYSAIPKRGLVAAENGIHDFGEVAPRDAANCEHSFVLHNTGSRPIRVTRSTSSCACTVAQLPDEPVSPGGSAVVKVRADWSKGDGHVVSRVVLYTDNAWTPEVVLLVSGEIIPTAGPTTQESR
jgi:hypothetical protein